MQKNQKINPLLCLYMLANTANTAPTKDVRVKQPRPFSFPGFFRIINPVEMPEEKIYGDIYVQIHQAYIIVKNLRDFALQKRRGQQPPYHSQKRFFEKLFKNETGKNPRRRINDDAEHLKTMIS